MADDVRAGFCDGAAAPAVAPTTSPIVVAPRAAAPDREPTGGRPRKAMELTEMSYEANREAKPMRMAVGKNRSTQT
jgi:hypothetical protein